MIVESPPPVPGQCLWFSTCFPLVDFPTGKIYRKIIVLSHFTFHLVWSTQRISKIFSAYTKAYSFYPAVSFGKWKINSGMGKLDDFFSISICFGVGARETRLSDNMTLGWKTERSARTNTKMLSTKQATDRSIDSFASCRTPKCEDFYKCNKTSLSINILPQMWK